MVLNWSKQWKVVYANMCYTRMKQMKQLLFPWLVVVSIQQGHAFCILPFFLKTFWAWPSIANVLFKLVNDACLATNSFFGNGKYVHCIGMKLIMSSHIWKWKISIYMFTKWYYNCSLITNIMHYIGCGG